MNIQHGNSSFKALMNEMDGSTLMFQSSVLFDVLYLFNTTYTQVKRLYAWRGPKASRLCCSQRGSVMHKGSNVVSWITDFKDRPHFVCVESSVSHRQLSSSASGDCTVTYSTSQVCVCTHAEAGTIWEWLWIAHTNWARYLKFYSPQIQSWSLFVFVLWPLTMTILCYLYLDITDF